MNWIEKVRSMFINSDQGYNRYLQTTQYAGDHGLCLEWHESFFRALVRVFQSWLGGIRNLDNSYLIQQRYHGRPSLA